MYVIILIKTLNAKILPNFNEFEIGIGVRAGGAGGAAAPPKNFGQPRFFGQPRIFGQQEKFRQSQLFKMFSGCFLNR